MSPRVRERYLRMEMLRQARECAVVTADAVQRHPLPVGREERSHVPRVALPWLWQA